MIKVFDCSNSEFRPHHRSISGGPKRNDIIRYLIENANNYGCTFVDDYNVSDIIITNDVYSNYILKLDRPRLKRMCSPYWKEDLLYRNIPLNYAANHSDMVVFISEYSRNSYIKMYGYPVFNNTVIHHWVDPRVFYPRYRNNIELTLVTSATNWLREEKRLNEVIKVAKLGYKIYIIGSCDVDLPSNVIKLGYISNENEMSKYINYGDIFLNLTYRDAATKTVPQAISCGIPIICASSGGVSEYVGDNGIIIKEDNSLGFGSSIPEIPSYDIEQSIESASKIKISNQEDRFDIMLSNYFNEIKRLCK